MFDIGKTQKIESILNEFQINHNYFTVFDIVNMVHDKHYSRNSWKSTDAMVRTHCTDLLNSGLLTRRSASSKKYIDKLKLSKLIYYYEYQFITNKNTANPEVVEFTPIADPVINKLTDPVIDKLDTFKESLVMVMNIVKDNNDILRQLQLDVSALTQNKQEALKIKNLINAIKGLS